MICIYKDFIAAKINNSHRCLREQGCQLVAVADPCVILVLLVHSSLEQPLSVARIVHQSLEKS